MSIIAQQRNQIQELIAENQRLNSSLQEKEADMKQILNAITDAWDYIGLDFSKMKSAMHVSSTLLKRITLGKIKPDELERKWRAIEPTAKKYAYLIEKKDDV